MNPDDPPARVVIPSNVVPERADKLLSDLLNDHYSRSALAKMIRQGLVSVGGTRIVPSSVLNPGDVVTINPTEPEPVACPVEKPPEIGILCEDNDIVVVNKPAGLTVHPGAGRPHGTLVDILIADRPQMIGVGESPRWGIVHRLDRDTSGVMVVAKSRRAHEVLSARFKEHSIHRVYLALVRGEPRRDSGTVDTPLGRHPTDRKRMSVRTDKPRTAVTHWRIKERLSGLTLLEVRPETGRTHQIRVHLASIGLPVAGDPTYGKTRKIQTSMDPRAKRALKLLTRQALHAAELGFDHPVTGSPLNFSAPLPKDMEAALAEGTPTSEF